jgi:hypothetical protein
MHDGAARQVRGQFAQTQARLGRALLAARLDGGDVGCRLGGGRRHHAAHQFKLRVLELFAGAAVLHAPQVGQFDLELVDGQQRDLQGLLRAPHFAAEAATLLACRSSVVMS